MQIRSYYYKDGDNTPVIVGVHNITVPAAWCVWRDMLASYPDRMAFLDIPADGDERIFLLALPGEHYRRIMFSIPLQLIRGQIPVSVIYDALILLDPETILAAVRDQVPFELDLPVSAGEEPLQIPVSTAELNGLQLIGNTRQALQTIARMIPRDFSRNFARTFFLAVNPPEYSDAFSTVVSDEMPNGNWKKLKTEHTDYSNSAVFHDRRKLWIRKHQRPRQLLLFMAFLICLLIMGIVCVHLLRQLQWTQKENQRLRLEKKELEFELQRLNHQPDQ